MDKRLVGIVARLIAAGVLTGGFIYLFPSIHWVIYLLVFGGLVWLFFEGYKWEPTPSTPAPTRGGEGIKAPPAPLRVPTPEEEAWREEKLQKERAKVERELERKKLREMAREEVLRREFRAAWQRGEVKTYEEFLEKQGKRKRAEAAPKESPF